MEFTKRLKSAFPWKMFWLLLLLLLTCNLSERITDAQDADIVSSCSRYKKSVFDKQDGYSFLFPSAPITYKTLDTCHSYTPLIVDGTPADPKEFPHMARLGNRNDNNVTNWFCGGTLISNRLVLTAAHCLYSESGEINVVRLGELDFDSDQDDAEPEDFGVRNTTEHPDFKYPVLYNDIALVELDRGVRFSVYKHPACLPFNDGERYSSFVAAGWGQTSFAGAHSSKLRKVKLNGFRSNCLQSDDVEELPSGYNATTQMCVGSAQNKDTCNGDSGGPLLTYHEEYPCMYHVMGITSLGIGCGTPNVPSLYTRVHSYLNWLKQEMAKIS
ncbi:serine protease snake-like [Drosophila hydei]|uniref:Serine protease snake-like n=1 Tax=Drosophila hydei TaxID=7224 RepID=A0A6J1LMW8_DROHY|nr:serine protease snake-like [Drosophila hydei]